jgi:hypothetical protein
LNYASQTRSLPVVIETVVHRDGLQHVSSSYTLPIHFQHVLFGSHEPGDAWVPGDLMLRDASQRVVVFA